MQDILLYINWNPIPDAITIGHFSIKWYGIMWGISLMVSFFVAEYVFKKANKDTDKITLIIQYIFIFGLIGARLGHVFFYGFDYYMNHPLEIPAVWKGGLASHGGVIGALVGIYFFCRTDKEFSFFWLLDHSVIIVMFLASFVRFGNLMNSELYGTRTNVLWAFIFERADNIPRHPVVLYESIAYLFIQFLMLYLFNKYKETKPGIYLVVFLLLVFGVRFMLEFYKEPDGGLIFGISKTQALNLPFIIAGATLFYFVLRGKLQYKTTPLPANG